jgi:hypothetical protein
MEGLDRAVLGEPHAGAGALDYRASDRFQQGLDRSLLERRRNRV